MLRHILAFLKTKWLGATSVKQHSRVSRLCRTTCWVEWAGGSGFCIFSWLGVSKPEILFGFVFILELPSLGRIVPREQFGFEAEPPSANAKPRSVPPAVPGGSVSIIRPFPHHRENRALTRIPSNCGQHGIAATLPLISPATTDRVKCNPNVRGTAIFVEGQQKNCRMPIIGMNCGL
jgi:hypothetical protein